MMQSEEFKILTCPYCGYNFPFTGKANRVQCHNKDCKRWFKQRYKKEDVATVDVKDDILKGNILDALEKADINPANHRELFRDAIPLILKKDDLKFAFAKAVQDRKRSPEEMMRKAVRYWLKEKGYL